MSTTLQSVEAAALKLNAQERAELIERLIDTVVPAEKVFADMRALIEGHGRKA